MEAAQHPHRFRHCLGRKQSSTEDAFTQASDFAVLVYFFQPPSLQAGNFQTNGIRSDVDSGKGGHRGDNGDDLMLTISLLTTGAGRARAARSLRGRELLANPLLALGPSL